MLLLLLVKVVWELLSSLLVGAVIAAFLFLCYLDLVPEWDVATCVSQVISCSRELPAW